MKSIFLYLCLLISGVSFLGCDQSGNGQTTTYAQARLIHAVPDVNNMDFIVYGKTLGANVAFKSASSYAELEAGIKTVQLNVPNIASTYVKFDHLFKADKTYTVLACNNRTDIRTLVLEENFVAPAAGKGRVRVIYAVPSEKNVFDLYISKPNADLEEVTVNKSGFKAMEIYETELAAGTLQLRLFKTSTAGLVESLKSDPFELVSGEFKTLLIHENKGGGTPYGMTVIKDK